MPRAIVTLRKVEMAEYALDDLLACADLGPADRDRLAAARAFVTTLRPAAPPAADHTPVAWDRGIIGCACGYRPDKVPARISMMMAPYHAHIAKLGVPRTDAPVIYGYGPKKGQRW